MPCHYEEYYNHTTQFKTAVEIVNGKIRIYTPKTTNDEGDFPTVKRYLEGCKKRFKTYQYKRDGETIVVVSPCPKGC